MIQIADAPEIRDAEVNGVGYEGPTEEEFRSADCKRTVLECFGEALNAVRKAHEWVESAPDGTVWEDGIAEMADLISDVVRQIEGQIREVEAWEI